MESNSDDIAVHSESREWELDKVIDFQTISGVETKSFEV